MHACLSCVISEQQPPLTPSFPSLFTSCRSNAQYFIHPFGVIFHYFPLFLHYFVLLTFASHICHSYTHQDSDIFYYSNYFDSTVNDIFIKKGLSIYKICSMIYMRFNVSTIFYDIVLPFETEIFCGPNNLNFTTSDWLIALGDKVSVKSGDICQICQKQGMREEIISLIQRRIKIAMNQLAKPSQSEKGLNRFVCNILERALMQQMWFNQTWIMI